MKLKKSKLAQLFVAAIVSSCSLSTQAAMTPFEELSVKYDVGDNEIPTGISVDGAGNMYLAGTRYYNGDHYLAKYDAYGREEWSTSYKTNLYNSGTLANEIVRKGDTVYMMLTESNAHGRLVKFDQNGAPPTVLIPGEGRYWSDQGSIGLYLDATEENLFLHATRYLMRYNLATGSIWRVNIMEGGYTWAKHAVPDKNGNVYFLVQMDANAAVYKFDGAGNELWHIVLDKAYTLDWAKDIDLMPDGGVVVLRQQHLADSSCVGGACNSTVVTTLSTDGTVQNSVTYSRDPVNDDEVPVDLDVGEDSSINLLSRAGITGNARTDIYVTKMGPDLSEQWSQFYTVANSFDVGAYDIHVDPVGGIIVGLKENYVQKVMRYSESGSLLWTYDGVPSLGYKNGFPARIELGATGEIYFAESSPAPIDTYIHRLGEVPMLCQ